MENWVHDAYFIVGNIYGDGRNKDGSHVQTTVVMELVEDHGDWIVVTKSGSRYLLGKPLYPELLENTIEGIKRGISSYKKRYGQVQRSSGKDS